MLPLDRLGGLVMTDTELPRSLAGRPIRPFAFALMLSCLTVLTGFIFRDTTGTIFDAGTVAGAIMTATSAVAVVALAAGWAARSEGMMRVGMSAAFGLWTSITAGLWLDIGAWTNSTPLAGCWAVAAAGSWLLEVSSDEDRT